LLRAQAASIDLEASFGRLQAGFVEPDDASVDMRAAFDDEKAASDPLRATLI
jgi:hypothetical protein